MHQLPVSSDSRIKVKCLAPDEDAMVSARCSVPCRCRFVLQFCHIQHWRSQNTVTEKLGDIGSASLNGSDVVKYIASGGRDAEAISRVCVGTCRRASNPSQSRRTSVSGPDDALGVVWRHKINHNVYWLFQVRPQETVVTPFSYRIEVPELSFTLLRCVLFVALTRCACCAAPRAFLRFLQ
jgi:hypothetical protein